jgi:sensor histidine kinase YesM
MRRVNPVVWFHALVWGLFFLPSIFASSPSYSLLERLGMEAGYLLYFAGAVYSNRFFLLPGLYRRGQRVLYFGLTFVLALTYGAAGLWLGHTLFGLEDSLLRLVSRFYFLGFIFAMIDAYFENQDKQRRLQQLEQQQVGMELRLLKAQVNPHFLFNTLNNLYALTLSNSPQAPAVVLQLAELMRYLFTTAPLEVVNLSQEVQHLRHYVELERLRLSQRAIISFNTQGRFDGQLLPPMLLIPFVENAFKHGVEAATGQVFVTIDLSLQGNELFFVVENSKPARLAAPTTPGTGLPNVRKRLALLFPGRHMLSIDDEPATYRSTLQLTL